MDLTTVEKIEDFIRTLKEEELVFLNRLITERLKLIDQVKTAQAMAKFNLGDNVQFTDNKGNIIKGRIIKLNKTTASILTTNNKQWKVYPGFLTLL